MNDDDDEKPPPIRLVSDNPNVQNTREREWSENQFSWALRETAANMLRIIRGAGKPYDLLLQLQKTLETAVKYQEAHGRFPDVAGYLRFESEYQQIQERFYRGELDQSYRREWWDDGTFSRMMAEHKIVRGALQMVASELIGQSTQRCAGHSELHDGIQRLDQIRDEKIKKERAAARATRPPAKKTIRKRRKPSVAKKAVVPKIEL